MLEIGIWDGLGRGRLEKVFVIPEDGVSRTERMQQVFRYSAGDETTEWWWRRLGLGAQEKR